ncbi:MAG: acyl carrier protein [Acidobacteria bacterium]|nr:MAG: acyl carrier protein [Acidobacteriota bacterium]
MQKNIEQELHDYIVGNLLFGQGVELRVEDSFLERGIIDSAGVLELIAFIEEKYGIEVENDELVPENLDSIRNITQFLMRKSKTDAVV